MKASITNYVLYVGGKSCIRVAQTVRNQGVLDDKPMLQAILKHVAMDECKRFGVTFVGMIGEVAVTSPIDNLMRHPDDNVWMIDQLAEVQL